MKCGVRLSDEHKRLIDISWERSRSAKFTPDRDFDKQKQNKKTQTVTGFGYQTQTIEVIRCDGVFSLTEHPRVTNMLD